jgi:hypothetical protein
MNVVIVHEISQFSSRLYIHSANFTLWSCLTLLSHGHLSLNLSAGLPTQIEKYLPKLQILVKNSQKPQKFPPIYVIYLVINNFKIGRNDCRDAEILIFLQYFTENALL